MLDEMHREVAFDAAGRKQWKVTNDRWNLFIKLFSTDGVCDRQCLEGRPCPPHESVNFNLLTFTKRQRETAGKLLEKNKKCRRRRQDAGHFTEAERWKAVTKILWEFGWKKSGRMPSSRDEPHCRSADVVSVFEFRTECWNRNGPALQDRSQRNSN